MVSAVSDLDLVVAFFRLRSDRSGVPTSVECAVVSTRQLRHLGCEWGHLVKRHTRVA